LVNNFKRDEIEEGEDEEKDDKDLFENKDNVNNNFEGKNNINDKDKNDKNINYKDKVNETEKNKGVHKKKKDCIIS
jgi:hypothetical protein